MKRSLFSPIEDVRQQVLLLPRCADSEDLSAVPAVTRHRWTVQYAHSQLDQQDKHQRCIRRKGRKTKEANTHTQKTVLSMGLKCGSDGAWYYSWSPGKDELERFEALFCGVLWFNMVDRQFCSSPTVRLRDSCKTSFRDNLQKAVISLDLVIKTEIIA
ncbi:hypothetical protein RRG08_003559 [Elysia crispata]|uniref:Uncharacterized protein n=1 Tax=Elysia crispata TaxID=231223 RepID=A0AAE0Y716_9GAST|nr:hypothetical protein RRG08_003559 [Elysia crispata]